MKKLFSVLMIVAAMLMVSGCNSIMGDNATTQSTQVTYVQACAAYGATFSAALQAREAGKLSVQNIKQISAIEKEITPICTGALPADPTGAIQQITAAVTRMAILGAVSK